MGKLCGKVVLYPHKPEEHTHQLIGRALDVRCLVALIVQIEISCQFLQWLIARLVRLQILLEVVVRTDVILERVIVELQVCRLVESDGIEPVSAPVSSNTKSNASQKLCTCHSSRKNLIFPPFSVLVSQSQPSFFSLSTLMPANRAKKVGSYVPLLPSLGEQDEHIAQLVLCQFTPGVGNVKVQCSVILQRRRSGRQLCSHTLACDWPCRPVNPCILGIYRCSPL